MRLGVLTVVGLLSTVSLCIADDVRADIKKETNIPAEDLGPALQTLASQRHFQVVYVSEQVDQVHTQGAKGQLTPVQALNRLLVGTGLTYQVLDQKTVTIVPLGAAAPTAVVSLKQTSGAPANQGAKEGKKSSSGAFRVAEVAQGTSSLAQVAQNRISLPQELQEVVVTAQKREQRLQDVPIPVTAINAEVLAENNQPRLQDFFSSVPALSFTPGILAQSFLAFRGISATGINTGPTVAVTVDDLPFTGTVNVIPAVIPDVDPSDLLRVEALRGPQGTLYGASSMGGLLKYVTVDPSTAGLSGQVQADVNSVYNGNGPGYGFRGAVNIPISETVAVRASAFTREDAGYIDNPVLHIDGINADRESGGRVSALWRPDDNFSLKLSALYEDTKGDSTSDVQPALGDLQQSFIRGCCGYDKQLQAYSANATAKLGIVDLTSVTGYIVNKFSESYDYTYLLGPLDLFGVSGAGDHGYGDMGRFSQELRAVLPIGNRLRWLIGGFYTHEDSPFTLYLPAINPNTGTDVGTISLSHAPTTYAESAAFTDFTVHVTDHFDVQIGGRDTQITEVAEASGPIEGAFAGPGTARVQSTHNAVTYLFTPEYKLSPDLMTYVRLASGYRPGQPNNNPDPTLPHAATPDKTQNYELGLKGDMLDHLLNVDASVYYIDWDNIQITQLDQNPDPRYHDAVYNTNGSRAKSEGVELSLQSHPLSGFTVAGWVAYDEAVLTESFPASSTVSGPAGSRLPYSARWSGNVSLNQEFPINGEITGYAGGQLSYLGDRLGLFLPLNANGSTPQRQIYPPYAKLDLRTGINFRSWTANLYANNVTDRRGQVGGGIGDLPPDTLRYIPPRVVGLSLTTRF